MHLLQKTQFLQLWFHPPTTGENCAPKAPPRLRLIDYVNTAQNDSAGVCVNLSLIELLML